MKEVALNIQNPELLRDEMPPSTSYSAWAKAGLVFGSSVGAFALAKTTGALSWLGGLLSSSPASVSSSVQLVNEAALTEMPVVPLMKNTDTSDDWMTRLPDVQTLFERQMNVAFEERSLSKSSVLKQVDSLAPKTQLLTTEFQVNNYTTAGQIFSSVAQLPNGGFVVTWTSDAQDTLDSHGVYAQRYDATGTRVGSELQVNTNVGGEQSESSVAALSTGGFVVIWSSLGQDGSGYGVYGQRYNANGVRIGDEFGVNTQISGNQNKPWAAGLTNGGFVVAWQSDAQDGSGLGVYARRYGSLGNPVSGELSVNTRTNGDQSQPSVAGLANGGFVVAWRSHAQDGSGFGIDAQRYDASGLKVGSEFRVSSTRSGEQHEPSVAAFSNGNFVVTWSSEGDEFDIYAQIYDASGLAVGSAFRVNNQTAFRQFDSSVATFSNGNFMVSWHHGNGEEESGYTIFGRLYNATGFVISNDFQVSDQTVAFGYDLSMAAATFSDGGFVVTWYGSLLDGSTLEAYARLYSPPALANNTITINQDERLVFNSTMLSANDADDNTATLIFTVSAVQNGHFELLSNAGVAITTFTQQQISSAQVYFIHTGGQNPPSYQISVSDGLLSTDPAPVSVQFNISPVLVRNVLTVNQDEIVTLNSNHLNATDSETAAGLLTFTVSSVQNGRFEFKSSPGVEISSFTQQQLNDAQVQFVHTGGASAPSYAVSVSDGGLSTSPVAATIDFNANPVLSSSSASTLSYTEGQGSRVIDNTITLSDVDDSNLSSAVVSLSDGSFVLGEDVLEFTNQNGITGDFDDSTGVLTLSGSATVAQYQAALRSVKYLNSSENPTLASRTVRFVVNDGILDSNSVSKQITLTRLNDAPTIQSSSGTTISYIEGQGSRVIDSTIILFDADNANLSGAVVRISEDTFVFGEDALVFTNQNGITGDFDASTGVLALSGSATIAQYQAALRSVKYLNSSENPTLATRAIHFLVNDGVLDSDSLSKQIAITRVNDAPVVGSSLSTLNYVSGAGAKIINSDLVLSDIDNTHLSNATVSIDGGYVAEEDRLSFTSQSGITGVFDSNTGVLTLVGSATLAQYQDVLRSVKYENTATTPSTEARTIRFTVTDQGGALSSSLSMQINIERAPISTPTPTPTPTPVIDPDDPVDIPKIVGAVAGAVGGAAAFGGAAYRVYQWNHSSVIQLRNHPFEETLRRFLNFRDARGLGDGNAVGKQYLETVRTFKNYLIQEAGDISAQAYERGNSGYLFLEQLARAINDRLDGAGVSLAELGRILEDDDFKNAQLAQYRLILNREVRPSFVADQQGSGGRDCCSLLRFSVAKNPAVRSTSRIDNDSSGISVEMAENSATIGSSNYSANRNSLSVAREAKP